MLKWSNQEAPGRTVISTLRNEENHYVNWPSQHNLCRKNKNNRARVSLIRRRSYGSSRPPPQREERLRDEPKERLGSGASGRDARVFLMGHVRGLFRFLSLFYQNSFTSFIKNYI